MKTVQITLDEALADEVDRTAERLGTTPSHFTEEALRTALAEVGQKELERRHREGYLKHPVAPGEVDDWEDEQVWID